MSFFLISHPLTTLKKTVEREIQVVWMWRIFYKKLTKNPFCKGYLISCQIHQWIIFYAIMASSMMTKHCRTFGIYCLSLLLDIMHIWNTTLNYCWQNCLRWFTIQRKKQSWKIYLIFCSIIHCVSKWISYIF